MEEAPRWTIEDLIARYTLEPELRDLYVEGPSDKLLFEWFLKQFECESVAVYEIDCVDVPDTAVEALGLQHNNRDRVVALSLELERLLPGEDLRVLCIADSDFAFLLGGWRNSRYLLYTDYTSVDLYFFCEHSLEKCLKVGIGRLLLDTSTWLTNLEGVLQKVFCVRAANEKLGWGIHWPTQFTRCCGIEEHLVKFDCTEFVRRYLSQGDRLRDMEAFNEVCQQLKSIEVKDPRQRIHGDDYLELVGWHISRLVGRGGHKYRDTGVVRAMIRSAIDVNSLAKEELFKKLLKYINVE